MFKVRRAAAGRAAQHAAVATPRTHERQRHMLTAARRLASSKATSAFASALPPCPRPRKPPLRQKAPGLGEDNAGQVPPVRLFLRRRWVLLLLAVALGVGVGVLSRLSILIRT